MAAAEQSGDLAEIWRKDGIERGTKKRPRGRDGNLASRERQGWSPVWTHGRLYEPSLPNPETLELPTEDPRNSCGKHRTKSCRD